MDIGILNLAYKAPGGAVRIVGPEIAYAADGWYRRTAGVVTFPVSSAEATALKDSPLCMIAHPRAGTSESVLLAENEDGVFVHADQFVFRIQPGLCAESTLYATVFGVPAAGITIFFRQDPSIMQVTSGAPEVGVPEAALSFPDSITTGPDGTAVLALTACNPENHRVYIDGQVYGVAYGVGAPPPSGASGNPSDFISVLVFDEYPVVDDPTWVGHIQPILAQYANLYPVMRPMVDLGSYASVMSRRQALKIVFFNKIENPNYMPVTRDMSENKRTTLQNWLLQPEPKYMNLSSREELCRALQFAIELEHSTIPVYLAALYSIKPGRNVYVAATIRSVVIEEMLHMALMANLLLSIGGSPNIGTPGFIPWYPGPLPGGVGTGLIARLRKCSIDQIRDVFMAIETPGTIAILENNEAIPGGPTEKTPYTIGWFYKQISCALTAQKDSLKFGQNMDKQPEGWQFEKTKLFKIDSFAKAEQAIKIIVEQGEGEGAFDPSDEEHMELAHYYKFAEIVVGRRLVSCGTDEKGQEQFSYTGSAVPFEEDGVYNMMDDPVLAEYPDGSRARVLGESFADTYQTMLNNLHVAFNGKPETLGNAVGMMYTLSAQARELMQTPSGRDDGTTAGIAFQPPIELLPVPDTKNLHAMKGGV